VTSPSGKSSVLPDAVVRWIDERELTHGNVEPTLVVALWNKAVATAGDSLVATLSPDNALQLAYQAQLQAATAMLHARGLRVRSRSKHHYVAIATARELAATDGAADLARAMVTLDGLRTDRAIAVYEPDPASPASAAHARSAMATLLPNALAWLLRTVPALAPLLHPIPNKIVDVAAALSTRSVAKPRRTR
jgi:hypothetical protein